MEALGAAASVIGVVSLALQLIQTVQGLNDFFTSLEGAPKEVQRLIEKLAHLKCVLQDVSNVVEMQRLQSGTPVLSSTMMAALVGCQRETEALEAILKKAQVGYGNRHRLVRKWNSLKVVVKKTDFKDFEDRIKDSMQRLTVSLMANLSTISISSHGGIKILLEKSGPAAQLSNTPVYFISEPPTQNQKSTRLQSRTVGQRSFRYGRRDRRLELVSSTQELVSTDTPNQHQMNIEFGRRKTISISIRFLQHFTRLKMEMASGCWKHSFIMYRIVSLEDGIWELCRKGDIPGLQELFTSGAYSPFITDDDGWTLIHSAAFHDQKETIMFLIQLGIDANIADNYGHLPLSNTNGLESCKALIEHGQNDPMVASPHSGEWWHRGPETILWILTQPEFLIESQELGNVLHDFAIYFARECYHFPFEAKSSDWPRILLHLLQDGLDLSGFNRYGQTPLDMFFSCDECQFDSQSMGTQWLELLASIQVDLKGYIAEEKRRHPSGFLIIGYLDPANCTREDRCRSRYIFWEDEDGKQNASWEWFIPSQSPAYVVLITFTGNATGPLIRNPTENITTRSPQWFRYTSEDGTDKQNDENDVETTTKYQENTNLAAVAVLGCQAPG